VNSAYQDNFSTDILVADDIPENLKLLRDLLTREGY
jgi:CheY-like chemotaxis protein